MACFPRCVALLVGGTGSGKSTLLSLLKPEIGSGGRAHWRYARAGRERCRHGRAGIGGARGLCVPGSENQIVCETVWHEMAFGLENLGLTRDEMRRRVAETSYFFGLED